MIKAYSYFVIRTTAQDPDASGRHRVHFLQCSEIVDWTIMAVNATAARYDNGHVIGPLSYDAWKAYDGQIGYATSSAADGPYELVQRWDSAGKDAGIDR